MKDNHSQKTTGTSVIPAAHNSNDGISAQPPVQSPLLQEESAGPVAMDDEQRIPEVSWHTIQTKKQWEQPAAETRELPPRFSLPAVSKPVPSSNAPVQRVGGIENNAYYCFLNSVIQLLEKSYDDLFDPNLNKVRDERAPVQLAIWNIITDLRADKIVPETTIAALRIDLHGRGMVDDCESQEDAQELMAKVIEYMVEGSVNFYPHTNNRLLGEKVTTTSDDKHITGDVHEKDATKDPSNITESHPEVGNSLIGIDINIYHTFEDFLYFLYGQGTTTKLADTEQLKVQKEGKQVYVNARTEKRSFTALPGVLTFYVKRFIGNRKITRDFPMPETVILVEEQPHGKQYKFYTREVIVRHTGFGDTLSGGHYYAVKKNELDEETRYSDASQSRSDESDPRQGSLYSYRQTGTKNALDIGDFAWQEVRPFGAATEPKTEGISIPDGGKPATSGNSTPISGGGSFSPFLGIPPIPSDKIRGLPNRAREVIPGQKRVVDCFINAILQLIAGSYRNLFDPAQNPLSDISAQEIQAAVLALIKKINQEDTAPIADGDIARLRVLLLRHKVVSSFLTQEDGGELMLFLLGLMMDITGKDLDLPDTDNASTTAVENKPGKLAKDQNTSLEKLVRQNPVLKDRQITTTERRKLRQKGLADPSIVPDDFKKFSALNSKWTEASEPLGNMIEIDIGQIGNFEEFLFQRYGKGGEQEDFSKGSEPRYKLNVGGQPANLAFKSRQVERRFTNLPPTLSFLVKRFTDGPTPKKDSREYALPQQLILVEEPETGKKRYKHYELKGIVVHTGKTMEEGHYYTHRKEGKDWIKANDQNVWKEDSPGGDLKQGYIYTYQLQGEEDQLQPGQQAPQEKYNLPDAIYLADAKLRPTAAMGFITRPKHRNTQAQNAVSGEINEIIKQLFPAQEGVFHAGHLFTSTFGGTGDARNLTPMWGSYNVGEYKNFEDIDLTELYGTAGERQQLYVKVEAVYPANDTPEEVFQGLLSRDDIRLLSNWFTLGIDHFKKALEAEKVPEKQAALQKRLEIAKSIQNFYPHLLRVCRRIPLQMYNTEARLVTFDTTGAYQSRGENQPIKIEGSPRALLGKLVFKNFLGASAEKRFFGPKQHIDLKGQDPDEWAVKTYADMPEPGVYAYTTVDGKAAGVDAYIWMDPEGIFSTFRFGGGTEDAGPAPQGFDWRLLNQASRSGHNKLYARAHLLNGKMHGSGNDPQNLSPFTQDANKQMSRDFEEKVKRMPQLIAPGRGIFWVSRLTGKVKRSGEFNTRLAEKRVALPLETNSFKKEKLELEIALAEEEAKMFGGIHFFAYEAEVQEDGTVKRGSLLLSAYFENCFSGQSGELGTTHYSRLFESRLHKMESLAGLEASLEKQGKKVRLNTEREALTYLSDAIAEEHANAAETYVKAAPPMAKDSPAFNFGTAHKDIQALMDDQLPRYYDEYVKYMDSAKQITKWNAKIEAHNKQITSYHRRKKIDDWRAEYNKLKKDQEDLVKETAKSGELQAFASQLKEWHAQLYMMVLHHVQLTGGAPSYAAITKTAVAKLDNLRPVLLTLTEIRVPKRKVEVRDGSSKSGSESDDNPRDKKKAKSSTIKTDSK